MVSETKQAECEEVWQARCYFKDVAEGKLSGKVLGKVYQRLAGLLKK